MEDFVFEWRMIVFPLAMFAYFGLMHWLDQRFANRGPLSDEEYLSFLARSRGASEYDLFRQAAATMHVTGDQIEQDFKDYLLYDRMPHYVRDYLRRQKTAAPQL